MLLDTDLDQAFVKDTLPNDHPVDIQVSIFHGKHSFAVQHIPIDFTKHAASKCLATFDPTSIHGPRAPVPLPGLRRTEGLRDTLL